MKNKTENYTAEQARALLQKDKKPIKVKAEKKVIGGKAEMDLSSSEVSQLIDSILLKAQGYVGYHEEEIQCRHNGCDVVITFKINKP